MSKTQGKNTDYHINQMLKDARGIINSHGSHPLPQIPIFDQILKDNMDIIKSHGKLKIVTPPEFEVDDRGDIPFRKGTSRLRQPNSRSKHYQLDKFIDDGMSHVDWSKSETIRDRIQKSHDLETDLNLKESIAFATPDTPEYKTGTIQDQIDKYNKAYPEEPIRDTNIDIHKTGNFNKTVQYKPSSGHGGRQRAVLAPNLGTGSFAENNFLSSHNLEQDKQIKEILTEHEFKNGGLSVATGSVDVDEFKDTGALRALNYNFNTYGEDVADYFPVPKGRVDPEAVDRATQNAKTAFTDDGVHAGLVGRKYKNGMPVVNLTKEQKKALQKEYEVATMGAKNYINEASNRELRYYTGNLVDSRFSKPTKTGGSKLAKYGTLGVAGLVLGGLVLSLSDSRGQQSNAQLYGQQPLY